MNNVEPVSYMSEHAMDAWAHVSSRISWVSRSRSEALQARSQNQSDTQHAPAHGDLGRGSSENSIRQPDTRRSSVLAGGHEVSDSLLMRPVECVQSLVDNHPMCGPDTTFDEGVGSTQNANFLSHTWAVTWRCVPFS